MDEKKLVENFVQARKFLDEKESECKQAQSIFDAAKEDLQNYITDNGILQTANYPDLGYISAKTSDDKPAVKIKAYVRREDEPMLHDYLRSIGRDDLIQPTVHYTRLWSFAEEIVQSGDELPEFVTVRQEPKIRWIKPKG